MTGDHHDPRSRAGLLARALAVALLLDTPFPSPLPAAAPSDPPTSVTAAGYIGSESCRECHLKFFDLWSTSFHGASMLAYTDALAAERLTTQSSPLKIHGRSFLAETGSGQGWVAEMSPDGVTTNPIRYLLGGKGLFYILTELGDGRLQALPLAYDVRRREWFDAVSSARGPHTAARDPALDDWHNPSRTFQIACVKCHSSQSASVPGPEGAVYPKTTWLEPGINCEVCHGPSAEHVRVCRAAPKGQRPADLRIVSSRSLTAEQNNASCLSCHAKMTRITARLPAGRPLLRPLRPHHARERGLLPGRPGHRRELHHDLMADEPVREGG